MKKNKIISMVFWFLLCVFSCQKQKNTTIATTPIDAKFTNLPNTKVSYPLYALDYAFNNTRNVSQTVNSSVSINLNNISVNGTYNVFYSLQTSSTGLPIFNSFLKQSVNFTAGVGTINININTANYPSVSGTGGINVYLMVQRTNTNQVNVSNIYSFLLYKRGEFSAPVSNGYGVTATTTKNAIDLLLTASIPVSLTLAGGVITAGTGYQYQLIAVLEDSKGMRSSVFTSTAQSLSTNMNFTVNLSSISTLTPGTGTLKMYLVASTASVLNPLTTLTTIAINPLTISMANMGTITVASAIYSIPNLTTNVMNKINLQYTNISGTGGGTYPAITATSTGVTGLTLSIPSGTVSPYYGTISGDVTGTPSGSGFANFSFTLLDRTVTVDYFVTSATRLKALPYGLAAMDDQALFVLDYDKSTTPWSTIFYKYNNPAASTPSLTFTYPFVVDKNIFIAYNILYFINSASSSQIFVCLQQTNGYSRTINAPAGSNLTWLDGDPTYAAAGTYLYAFDSANKRILLFDSSGIVTNTLNLNSLAPTVASLVGIVYAPVPYNGYLYTPLQSSNPTDKKMLEVRISSGIPTEMAPGTESARCFVKGNNYTLIFDYGSNATGQGFIYSNSNMNGKPVQKLNIGSVRDCFIRNNNLYVISDSNLFSTGVGISSIKLTGL